MLSHRTFVRPCRLLATAALALAWTGASGTAQEPASFPQPARPPAGAPNVLIIMTDDVGFASSSTFGGAVPTPALDQLAKEGLTYTNFHTTSICSPTRAALLTGRNHHAVGFGSVSDLARGEPGYTSIMPKSAGTVAQILSGVGYDTAWLGKHHNVPMWQVGSLGPFDQWAVGLGFQYFYGFHGGHTDQFAPHLIENTRMIDPPAPAGDGTEAGYVLDRDMADRAIDWLRSQRAQHPDAPFLMYYAPGTAHAPLQAPAEWIARFKGKFDAGWDAYRGAALARQKKMGIVPGGTQMAPLPEGVRPWATLSPDERKVAARHMEVYAAMLAYCDAQIGRLLDELKRTGQYDNTLVVFIQGDNGASPEGGDMGGYNYTSRVMGGTTSAQETAHALANLDAMGGPRSSPVAPVGWAVALNTPFPYYKTIASRLGGIRNGMVVSWPGRVPAGGARRQFVHVTDILPTILDAAGVAAPESLAGIAQQPFDGISFKATFAQARAPSAHRTQYFEVFGNGAIYHDGWMLAAPLRFEPRSGASVPDMKGAWQLFDLTNDFSQARDVAALHPGKVAELKAIWQREAARNHVLPLFSGNVKAMLPGVRPEPLSEPGRHRFSPVRDRFPEGVFPAITNRSWAIEAELVVPAGGAQGMIATQGGRPAGWGLALLGGVPTFLYRTSDRADGLLRLSAPVALAPGRHKVAIRFTADGPGFGRGGAFVLSVDGAVQAEGRLDRTVPFKFAPEDATIGRDTGTPLIDDYGLPFGFTGTLDEVIVELGPIQPPPGMGAK